MGIFIKYTGNFKSVMDKLREAGMQSFSPELYAPQAGNTPQGIKKFYVDEVEKDEGRTVSISRHHTVAELHVQLKDTSHLCDKQGNLKNPNKPLSFCQGAFDGGLFTETVASTSTFYVENIQNDHEDSNDPLKKMLRSLRINYANKGVHCAFAITYVRDDSPKSLQKPWDKRKLYPIIAIINNVNGAVDDREVTLFIHKKLHPQNASKNSQKVHHRNLMRQVSNALDSDDFMTPLIQGLMVKDSVSLPHFNQLASRLRAGENLDNKDAKKAQIDRLFEIAKDDSLKNFEFLQDQIQAVQDNIKNDIHFFKAGNFEKNLVDVFVKIQESLRFVEENERYHLDLKNKFTFHKILIELMVYDQRKIGKPESSRRADILKEAARKIDVALANPLDEGAKRAAAAITIEYTQIFQIDLLSSTPQPKPPLATKFWQRSYAAVGVNVGSLLTLASLAVIFTIPLFPIMVAAGAMSLLATAKILRNEFIYKEKINQFNLADQQYKVDLERAKSDFVSHLAQIPFDKLMPIQAAAVLALPPLNAEFHELDDALSAGRKNLAGAERTIALPRFETGPSRPSKDKIAFREYALKYNCHTYTSY